MNLAEIIEGHPDEAPALLAPDRTMTYGQLRAEVAWARGGLARLGVEPGDRVVLALPNDWPFVVAYLAVLGAGAAAVPLDPSLPPQRREERAAFVGARVTLTDLSQLPEGGPVPPVDRAPDDPALLVFTAGTAGPAKAAVLTHGSLRANLDQVQQHPGRALLPNDVSYGVLPFFHVFGVNVVLGLSLVAGSSVVLVDRFDPAEALATIASRRVTILAGAPPLFAALAAMPPVPTPGVNAGTASASGRGGAAGSPPDSAGGEPGSELVSVRLAVSGASALPAEVAAAFERRFGLPVWQGYGLTEASPVVTSSVIGGVPKPGSVGVPLPGVKIRLIDEAGEDALVGDPGELWVSGPNVFAGYWEDPEATASVLQDGWLRTGDVAVLDDDGYVFLVDRLKDIVIVSGFNVYPAEVEDVLREDGRVADVAVVGVPDRQTGEAVKAYVVPVSAAGTARDGSQEGRSLVGDLLDHCRRRLAPYECPHEIEVVDSLPHGMAGKLLRRALRSPAGDTS